MSTCRRGLFNGGAVPTTADAGAPDPGEGTTEREREPDTAAADQAAPAPEAVDPADIEAKAALGLLPVWAPPPADAPPVVPAAPYVDLYAAPMPTVEPSVADDAAAEATDEPPSEPAPADPADAVAAPVGDEAAAAVGEPAPEPAGEPAAETEAEAETPEPVVRPRGPIQGTCPLCEEDFDDLALFKRHLAVEHGLEDDEGTETDYIPQYVATLAEAEELEPEPAATPAAVIRPEVDEDDDSRVPLAAIAAVITLIVIVSAAFFVSSSSKSPAPTATAEGADAPTALFTPTTVAASPAAAEVTPEAAGSEDAPAPALPAPTAAGVVPEADPAAEPAPVETPAPPAPPPAFALPSAISAKVDGCTRDHGKWVMTYSWQFVGGASWVPLSSYTSLGGGRYQTSLTLKSGTVGAVQVLDPAGLAHNVWLSPPVSSDSC